MAVRGRRVPLPREHGAWMMLFAPLVTGLAAFATPPLPAALLLLAVSALFFAQNALGLHLRGRGAPGNLAWLIAFTAAGVAAGAVLLLRLQMWRLLPLAVPAGLLFAWQALRRRRTRRQIDHSTANEAATAAVMALGASAAALAAGRSATHAAIAWLVFAVYFVGSVLYVKMRVADARSPETSGTSALACGLFHAVAAAACGLWAWLAVPGALAGLAVAPGVGRAWVAWIRLDGSMPSLRRLGVAELIFASWFSLWMGVTLYCM